MNTRKKVIVLGGIDKSDYDHWDLIPRDKDPISLGCLGANQAIACRRLLSTDHDVEVLSKLREDDDEMLDILHKDGVGIANVLGAEE